MIIDPVADMLIRIKNGYMAGQKQVAIPYSRFKLTLADVLKKQGFIGESVKDKSGKEFTVTLVYQNGLPSLSGVKRISKPGLRRYVGVGELNLLHRGVGKVILSTPRGLKTHLEAKKENLGGEVVCKVW